jgi:hypothetical protein
MKKINMDQKAYILENARIFFDSPTLTNVDFFQYKYICDQCHQSFTLQDLIVSGKVNSICTRHEEGGFLNGRTNRWSCCGKDQHNRGCNIGCIKTIHSPLNLLAYSQKEFKLGYIAYPFFQCIGHMTLLDNITFNIPIDIWLTLMYTHHGGSFNSFSHKFDFYFNKIFKVIRFKSNADIQKYKETLKNVYSRDEIKKDNKEHVREEYINSQVMEFVNHNILHHVDEDNDQIITFQELEKVSYGNKTDNKHLYSLIVYKIN